MSREGGGRIRLERPQILHYKEEISRGEGVLEGRSQRWGWGEVMEEGRGRGKREEGKKG